MKNKVYCCVPYCETGLRSDTEELKLFTTNRKELQKKWARAIQRPNYKFTKHSAVCILHFHKDDVLKGRMLFTYGKEVFIPYKVWKLKEGAIPEIFPGITRRLIYFSNTVTVFCYLFNLQIAHHHLI